MPLWLYCIFFLKRPTHNLSNFALMAQAQLIDGELSSAVSGNNC